MQVEQDTHHLINEILAAYPHLASELIRERQDMSDPTNKTFAKHPDDPAEHEFHWHQFGIITHCRRFQQSLEQEVPAMAEKWGVWQSATKLLATKIDGLSRWQLLQLVAVLHDVGKFTAGRSYIGQDGRRARTFKGHEEQSGQIIRGQLHSFLIDLGLSAQHIEYIAHCSELHFELGKVRREVRRDGKYTIAFTQTKRFRHIAEQIINTHADIALEIGLLFIADSISKIEVMAIAETDADIPPQKAALTGQIAKRQIDPGLIEAALQMPVNVKAAEAYLRLWQQTVRRHGILWLALSDKSHDKLKKAFPPRFANEFYHHVTLAFGTPQLEVTQFIGRTAKAEVYAHAANNKVEAVRVTTFGLPDTYGVPHVTLSTAEGIEPFESVAMLRGNHDETQVQPPLVLEGLLEFKPFKS